MNLGYSHPRSWAGEMLEALLTCTQGTPKLPSLPGIRIEQVLPKIMRLS